MVYDDTTYPFDFPTEFIEWNETMSVDILNTDIRDTQTYQSQPMKMGDEDKAVVQIANSLNADINYSIEATYDQDSDTFDDAITVGSGTVSASTNDYALIDNPWDNVRLVVTAATSPSSGTLLAKGHR